MDLDIDQQVLLEFKFRELSLSQPFLENLLIKEIKSLLLQRELLQIQRRNQLSVQQDDQMGVKNQVQKEVEKHLQATDFILLVVDHEVIRPQLHKNVSQERLLEQNKFEKSQNHKNQAQWYEQTLTPHIQVQINPDPESEKKQRRHLKLERNLLNERTVKKT